MEFGGHITSSGKRKPKQRTCSVVDFASRRRLVLVLVLLLLLLSLSITANTVLVMKCES